MANKKEKEEIEEQVVTQEESKVEEPVAETPKAKTKSVRNRSDGKIELLINNEVVVFPPKGTVEVPIDFDVPNGIGLYVK